MESYTQNKKEIVFINLEKPVIGVQGSAMGAWKKMNFIRYIDILKYV